MEDCENRFSVASIPELSCTAEQDTLNIWRHGNKCVFQSLPLRLLFWIHTNGILGIIPSSLNINASLQPLTFTPVKGHSCQMWTVKAGVNNLNLLHIYLEQESGIYHWYSTKKQKASNMQIEVCRLLKLFKLIASIPLSFPSHFGRHVCLNQMSLLPFPWDWGKMHPHVLPFSPLPSTCFIDVFMWVYYARVSLIILKIWLQILYS